MGKQSHRRVQAASAQIPLVANSSTGTSKGGGRLLSSGVGEDDSESGLPSLALLQLMGSHSLKACAGGRYHSPPSHTSWSTVHFPVCGTLVSIAQNGLKYRVKPEGGPENHPLPQVPTPLLVTPSSRLGQPSRCTADFEQY